MAPLRPDSPRALSVALGVALALSACGEPPPKMAPPVEPAAAAGGVLRVLHEEVGTLDPVLVDDAYEGTVCNQLYEGLVQLDRDLRIAPALARSWVISEDGRNYLFRLRTDVSFHAGQRLTAEIAARSLERNLAPSRPGPSLAEGYFQRVVGASAYQAGKSPSISGIRAIDDETLEVQLEEPLSFFLAVLTMDQARIVGPTESNDWSALELRPNGTGPFRFGARSEDGSMVLARHDGYWAEPAYLDSLRFVVAGPSTSERAVALLLRGEVDAASVAPRLQSFLVETAGLRTRSTPEFSVTFLGFNLEKPPFDRLEVRQAVTACLDRAALAASKSGTAMVASRLLPPGMPGIRPSVLVPPADAARAREYAAKAGIDPAHPLEVTLSTNRSPVSNAWWRDHFAPPLAAVGLKLVIEQMDWPDLDAKVMGGETEMFTMSWIADVPDPDAILYFLFHTDEANNLFAFSDAHVDSMLEVARHLPPGSPRFELYAQIEASIIEQLPMTPLYHATSLYAWNPRVEGVEASPLGAPLMRFGKVWFRRPALESGAAPASAEVVR